MDTQYFVVERLEEKGGDRMESALTEMEEFLEKLDLTPQEGFEIARILERLRDEVTAL
ncbi:MAG: hypothetical protein ACRCTP_10725 [Aeromonas popoffii]|uniref:hypothetical protein n=1 Tax=Aeromonas popoffii TaxID=70856 RepID=UPI003F3D2087